MACSTTVVAVVLLTAIMLTLTLFLVDEDLITIAIVDTSNSRPTESDLVGDDGDAILLSDLDDEEETQTKDDPSDDDFEADELQLPSQAQNTDFSFLKSDRLGLNLTTKGLKARVQEKDEWLSLAFIGDSLTRYQYLSLANYAKFSEYIKDNERPNPLQEKTYNAWPKFYRRTNSQLEPYELCDCSRYSGTVSKTTTFENRFYYDEKAKISLSYVQAFGDDNIHGHFSIEEVNNRSHHMSEVFYDGRHVKPATWSSDWVGAVKYVAGIKPKPKYLIMNEGQWLNSFWRPNFVAPILAAAKEANLITVWKTTTYSKGHHLTSKQSKTDKMLCKLVDICLDVSWTRKVKSQDYWDRIHFVSYVYNAINEQLLRIIGF